MTPSTPEQSARADIDRQLEAAGWAVQDCSQIDITSSLGVAIREFPLQTGFADYMLYADGKAIGIVEAKAVGHTLTGVEIQSAKYTTGLPEDLPSHGRPLPFAYESTGKVTQFTNGLDPQPCSREVFTFHRPEELIRFADLGADQLRANLQTLPALDTTRLWRVQVEAIENLEKSLAQARLRALIQMATGSGKTYTACSFCYRLIKFAKAKRILFLVDRNNLGKQTLNEFQQYASPYSKYSFTEEFPVQQLKRNTIDPASKVCITTIQRLYSILKGDPELPEDAEESSMFESASPLIKEPLPVVYNPAIPIEHFDFIVVDECHRSIYNIWRQVLEYFDSFIIGLTATPTAQTVGFFDGNVVQDYSHERAVADGVNVGFDVYRIQTEVTANGATLKAVPKVYVPHRDRRTRQKRLRELEEDVEYTSNQLDRDVVNPSQIRLIIRTFKDRLFNDIFPGRKEVPKTLIFAKTDLHADDIVKIVRDEFGRGNDFCVKITSKTTGAKPEDLLSQFRNSFNPRIAVTVDMIATGTDVKPLECLLFMRNINSAAYFDQMKGRGCRIITADDLQAVTPDTRAKTRFVIVDAVGVCENDKSASKPLDRQPSVPLEKVLQTVAKGVVHADVVSTLAARLARLEQQMDESQAEQINSVADEGQTLANLSRRLLDSIDPIKTAEVARQKFNLAADAEPTEEQLDKVEHERMAAALKPFHKPALRNAILAVKSSLEQVIDEITQDQLLDAGFDAAAKAKAQSILEDFRKFLEDHKNEIEAVKLLYSRPHREGLRYSHVKALRDALEKSLNLREPSQRLWTLYEAVEPQHVKGRGGAVHDLVQLVKHALKISPELIPRADEVEARYQQWLTDQQAAGAEFTSEQRKWLDAIRDHLITSLHIEADDFAYAPFSQLGGLGKAHQLFGDRLPVILNELNVALAA